MFSLDCNPLEDSSDDEDDEEDDNDDRLIYPRSIPWRSRFSGNEGNSKGETKRRLPKSRNFPAPCIPAFKRNVGSCSVKSSPVKSSPENIKFKVEPSEKSNFPETEVIYSETGLKRDSNSSRYPFEHRKDTNSSYVPLSKTAECKVVDRFPCMMCNALFSGKSELLSHMKCHAKEQHMSCCMCPRIYSSPASMIPNYSSWYDKRMVCKMCSQMLPGGTAKPGTHNQDACVHPYPVEEKVSVVESSRSEPVVAETSRLEPVVVGTSRSEPVVAETSRLNTCTRVIYPSPVHDVGNSPIKNENRNHDRLHGLLEVVAEETHNLMSSEHAVQNSKHKLVELLHLVAAEKEKMKAPSSRHVPTMPSNSLPASHSTISGSAHIVDALQKSQQRIDSRSARKTRKNGDADGDKVKRKRKKRSNLMAPGSQLYEFVLQLLDNPQYHDAITWTRREHGEFRVLQPDVIAGMWGRVKKNADMTYDSLSRSLRHYYKQGILCSMSKKMHYQFTQEALRKWYQRIGVTPSSPDSVPSSAS